MRFSTHWRTWPDRLLPSAVAVACAVLVGVLIDGVREHADLSSYDPSVTTTVIGLRSQPLTAVAETVTALGSVPVLVALAALVSAGLSLRWLTWELLATMTVALAGSAVLTYSLKQLVARQRPPLADMLGGPDRDFAFPSGHTLNSAVFLVVLCWLLRRHLSRAAHRAVRVAAVLPGAAVGASRVYLGYHWLTDVLAGWVVATGWLALLLAVRRYRTEPP